MVLPRKEVWTEINNNNNNNNNYYYYCGKSKISIILKTQQDYCHCFRESRTNLEMGLSLCSLWRTRGDNVCIDSLNVL